MKKYVALFIAVIVLVVLVVWLEPTGSVRGRLRGEKYFEGRPTSYWVKALNSDDPSVSANASKALGSGGADAAAVLDQMLRSHDKNDANSTQLRIQAADLLGRNKEAAKDYSDTLLAMLDDEDRQVRTIAAKSLPKVGTSADVAVPALTKMLDNDERVDVARALSEYQADAAPALEPLVKILKDKSLDSEARWNAARTLGKMRAAGAPAIPALVECLQDEAPTVREHSAEALGDMGPAARESVDALIATLSDTVPRVRRDAARSLGQIGVTDPKVMEALQKLTMDENEEVREFAINALKALGASQASTQG